MRSASTSATTTRCAALYFDQEAYDGYLRDRDVFDAGISIEDNLSLVVDYSRGASMSYSLNAHAPWEGYTVAINGTRGRAELTVVERGAVLLGGTGRPGRRPERATRTDVGDESGRPVSERLVVQRHFEPARDVAIPVGEGGHGGGDSQLLSDVFDGAGEDPLGRRASWLDGVLLGGGRSRRQPLARDRAGGRHGRPGPRSCGACARPAGDARDLSFGPRT